MLSTAVLILTLTIYHEAGNQPEVCQQFVAETVINRMSRRKLTAEQVIREKNQFEWLKVLRGKSLMQTYIQVRNKKDPMTKKSIATAERLARQVLQKGYMPMYQGQYFQSLSEGVPKWYKHHFVCGQLVFEDGDWN